MFGQDGFFARRWRRQVRLPILFWRDMLGVGTGINLLVSFMALMAAAQGVDSGLAVALHFAPLPYNLFLVIAVWRLPQRTAPHSVTAAAWLALMTIV